MARKRGRNRKPPSSKGGGAVAAAADRYEAAAAAGVRAEGPQLQQQHPKVGEEPRVAGAVVGAGAAVANPPPQAAKGFRRKGNTNKKRAAAAAAAGGRTTPPPPKPPSSSSADALTAYFKTLKKIKLLKPDEEVVLGRRIQRGERVRVFLSCCFCCCAVGMLSRWLFVQTLPSPNLPSQVLQ